MKVLEIGTGSASKVVILAEMERQLNTMNRKKNYSKPINHLSS